MVSQDEIEVFWVQGKQQIAEALTKRGASTDKLIRVLESCVLLVC